MAIKAVYKIDGSSEEYETEQQAQIAEILEDLKACYIENYKIKKIATAITEKFHLIPINENKIVSMTPIFDEDGIPTKDAQG
jgi:hypothetical protein